MKTRTCFAMLTIVANVSVSSHAHTVYLDIQKDKLIWQQIDGVNFHSYDARITEEGQKHNLDNYGKWHLSKDATKLSIRVREQHKNQRNQNARESIATLTRAFQRIAYQDAMRQGF